MAYMPCKIRNHARMLTCPAHSDGTALVAQVRTLVAGHCLVQPHQTVRQDAILHVGVSIRRPSHSMAAVLDGDEFQHLLSACRAKQEAGVLTSGQVANIVLQRDALVAAALASPEDVALATKEDLLRINIPVGVANALKKAFPGVVRYSLNSHRRARGLAVVLPPPPPPAKDSSHHLGNCSHLAWRLHTAVMRNLQPAPPSPKNVCLDCATTHLAVPLWLSGAPTHCCVLAHVMFCIRSP
jgi:hypothetical protein